jgi:Ser/Thr protein kinase RdoA (MazF antagonist)
VTDIVDQALTLWDMTGAKYRFVAGRENLVYCVFHDGERHALRLKRPGYRERKELASELDWMAEMARAGLSVPTPRLSKSRNRLEQVGGHFVDVITWLPGTPLGQSRAPLQLADPERVFSDLGAEMARLHLACDAWTAPEGFTRCTWDIAGLLGRAPLWGRFWENPMLDTATCLMLRDFRTEATQELSRLDLDAGLIHADLVPENVLIDGTKLRIIDFDDGGYGFRLFDVATALLKHRADPKYPALKQALLGGYLSVRPLDMAQLDLFLALRAVTYVGWIISRMDEPGSPERNRRFIQDAQELCGAWRARYNVNQEG